MWVILLLYLLVHRRIFSKEVQICRMAEKKEVSFAESEGDGRKAAVRVIAGADGFGSELKDVLIEYMKEKKSMEVVDVGVDKYYTVAVRVASQLATEKKDSRDGPLSRGLLVCGTGVGVSIFANKFGGVYAAACNSVEEAVNARSINNTNVLTLGAKVLVYVLCMFTKREWGSERVRGNGCSCPSACENRSLSP